MLSDAYCHHILKINGYCYHSVYVITFGLAQNDHIKHFRLSHSKLLYKARNDIKNFFWCAPFGYLYFFLQWTRIGCVGIDPGMALTPLLSSIGRGSNLWPSDRESRTLPLDHSFRGRYLLVSMMEKVTFSGEILQVD